VHYYIVCQLYRVVRVWLAYLAILTSLTSYCPECCGSHAIPAHTRVSIILKTEKELNSEEPTDIHHVSSTRGALSPLLAPCDTTKPRSSCRTLGVACQDVAGSVHRGHRHVPPGICDSGGDRHCVCHPVEH
jgi:hypothetical protein